MRTYVCLLCLLCASVLRAEDRFIMLTNVGGATILAMPTELKEGTLTLKRSDGQQFRIPIGSLNRESRVAVLDYLAELKTAALAPPPPAEPSAKQELKRQTVHVTEPKMDLQLDNRFIARLTYEDPAGDSAEDLGELDITEVKLEQVEDALRIVLQFASTEHGHWDLEHNLARLELRLDVDNSLATGQQIYDKAGVDTTIVLSNESGQWATTMKHHDEITQNAYCKVDEIHCAPHSLSFNVHSSAMKPKQAYRVQLIVTNADGKPADSFPDQGAVIHSFDYYTYRTATDAAAWE
ncbi:hypothetical protein [Cerasicoccus frondis]|uniref:hypothetical protein n=1 Tax=Cerasicoccus frondis TaxID=490090 RepID=UPI00285270C6|nr:hypothetical protein [Cerasicoccus frondis]